MRSSYGNRSRGGAVAAVRDRPRHQPRRRRAAQRARADPARGDAEHRPGRDRHHDPGHRGARGRRRPRRLHPVPVAVLDLPARPGRLGPDLLQARRPVRPQADDAGRGRAVPGRLAAVRPGVEHALADRLPRGAGPRRRSGAADRDDDRRRHLLGRGAGQGAGLPRQRLGAGRRGRPDAGRRLLRLRLLAVDLLRQPADRRSPRCGCCVRRFEEQVEQARHRFDVLGAVLLTGGGVLLLLGLLEGGVRWVVVLGAPASRSSPPPRSLLAAFVLVETRAAEPVLPLWVLPAPRDPARDAHLAGRRRAADGADVVHPALRAGRARPRRGDVRVRARRADAGLAAVGVERRPALPVDRVPGHDGDRGAVRAGGRPRCC